MLQNEINQDSLISLRDELFPYVDEEFKHLKE